MSKKPNILIIGDIMLDENIFVNLEKIANEAPIPVFNVLRKEHDLGGCGNVLKNMVNLLCENIYIFSIVGNDANGQLILDKIQSLGVHGHVYTLDNYITTTKTRYYCENKIVFRSDIENTHTFDSSILIEEIESVLQTKPIDCILFSDYNKGVLSHNLCRRILEIARAKGVFTCVDPKNDYRKYIGCSLIKPNLAEARKLFNLSPSIPILDIHTTIFEKVQCAFSVVTMSEKGITAYDGKTMLHETPHVCEIIDVTGAGDIVNCILAYFLCQGHPLTTTLRMATNIGTKSVQSRGTYTLSRKDILGKIVSLNDIQYLRNSEPLVFTNGCFDLLHSGHIKLLEFCKTMGSVVLGLNSDSSITRLKGTTRPVNSLQTRLDILGSIQYIDYIIVFDEDTPYNIIKQLQPDVLVKGGDYKLCDIVGSEFAKKTVLFDYMKNMSSSLTIQKILHSV